MKKKQINGWEEQVKILLVCFLKIVTISELVKYRNLVMIRLYEAYFCSFLFFKCCLWGLSGDLIT